MFIARHNEVQYKLLYLDQQAFSSAYVCAKPLIHRDRRISDRIICQGSEKLETWGGLIIWDLWDRHNYSIIDVKLGDADADSYKYEPMTELLARWEMIKNYKHGNHCHEQRKNCPPFVLSVDGMLGR